MRIYLTIPLLFLFILYSCEKKQISKEKYITEIYNENDFKEKVVIIDSFCIKETQRAQHDIDNGKIILNIESFCNRNWLDSYYFSADLRNRLINEARKYKIEVDTNFILHSCIVQTADFYFDDYCYNKIMKQEIERKFTANFIDSIGQLVQQQYIMAMPDSIWGYQSRDNDFWDYEYEDTCDDFIQYQKLIFENKFQYPKGYEINNEEASSYTESTFILMKDGSITNIETKAKFANPQNEKFRKYFESSVEEFVKSIKWQHPTYSGIVVNNQMNFSFFHK